MESLSQANSAFALDLYRTVSESSPDTNLFFSPLSVSAALAMIYLGARGTTAEEIDKVMSFSSVPDVHTHFNFLISEINSPKSSYILKLANRLYGEKTFNFSPDFVNSTLNFYQAEMQPVNFIGASEETRKLINLWVEEKTEKIFKDILKPGMVNEMTRLSLVNAIYFKGKWKDVFKPENTKEMPFKINKNETKPVQMMHLYKKLPYSYIPEFKLKMLELPYEEAELSMLVLLPDDAEDGSDPLQKLEKDLTVDQLCDWTKREKMSIRTNIIVHLPKFKLEEEYSLEGTLSKMGMSSLFQETAADLTGMSSDGGLFVSSAIHKAFVEVNEEGTEAAAVTVFNVRDKCRRPLREYFTADHPFLFFIRHNPTNSILFLGRFKNPR